MVWYKILPALRNYVQKIEILLSIVNMFTDDAFPDVTYQTGGRATHRSVDSEKRIVGESIWKED